MAVNPMRQAPCLRGLSYSITCSYIVWQRRKAAQAILEPSEVLVVIVRISPEVQQQTMILAHGRGKDNKPKRHCQDNQAIEYLNCQSP